MAELSKLLGSTVLVGVPVEQFLASCPTFAPALAVNRGVTLPDAFTVATWLLAPVASLIGRSV